MQNRFETIKQRAKCTKLQGIQKKSTHTERECDRDF